LQSSSSSQQHIKEVEDTLKLAACIRRCGALAGLPRQRPASVCQSTLSTARGDFNSCCLLLCWHMPQPMLYMSSCTACEQRKQPSNASTPTRHVVQQQPMASKCSAAAVCTRKDAALVRITIVIPDNQQPPK
jgi:hypothetical protein